jgi:GT2 family glycosyltransferase
MISFIIPCFQQARYLRQAVASVLDQAGVEVEAVIVDDESSDEPLAQLGPLALDPRVRYIRQEHAGVSAARNRGIRESRGKYLCFLDADDWMAPEFGAELSRALESDEALAFVYSDLQLVREKDSRQGQETAAPGDWQDDYSSGASRRTVSGDIFTSLLQGGYFAAHSVLVRRAVLDETGYFDESLGGHEDWELWLRIAAGARPALYVDRKLAFYRQHGANTSLNRAHMAETQLAALRKVIRLFPDKCAGALQSLIRLTEEEAGGNRRLFEQQNQWIARLEEARRFHEQAALAQRQELEQLRESKAALLLQSVKQQRWIAQVEEAKAWLERELAQQKDWIGRLEGAKTWQERELDKQSRHLLNLEGELLQRQRWIEELERQLAGQKQWAAQLEEDKSWQERELAGQKRWIAELEEAKAWQEQQAKNWEETAARLQRSR